MYIEIYCTEMYYTHLDAKQTYRTDKGASGCNEQNGEEAKREERIEEEKGEEELEKR